MKYFKRELIHIEFLSVQTDFYFSVTFNNCQSLNIFLNESSFSKVIQMQMQVQMQVIWTKFLFE